MWIKGKNTGFEWEIDFDLGIVFNDRDWLFLLFWCFWKFFENFWRRGIFWFIKDNQSNLGEKLSFLHACFCWDDKCDKAWENKSDK